MRLIDTHCHIQFDAYDNDRDAVIHSCAEKEIGLMVVGCDEKSSRDALALVEKMGSGIIGIMGSGAINLMAPDPIIDWCSVGQHPTDSGQTFDYKTFYNLARSSKKVRAIGECGLDYYHLDGLGDRVQGTERQKDLFFQHLNLAHELNLPLIIHCRDAHDDMIEILVHRFGIADTVSADTVSTREHGVLHCFTGTARDAQSYLDLGFMISFTGIITFTDQYDDVVRTVPLEKMLVETDAPFLAPVPHRGKRNFPEYVEYIARRIAEIKDIPYEEVARVTTENAKRLFGLTL
ncbi:TatD family hydrolase [Candidatus Uhrbacteria bacterium]|nr:TatD family hydrolase [Candidatus Uhrbacteria bacterium]